MEKKKKIIHVILIFAQSVVDSEFKQLDEIKCHDV